MSSSQLDAAAITRHFPKEIGATFVAGEDGVVCGFGCRCEGIKIFGEKIGRYGGQEAVLSESL
jgi:hypothetical protein